MENTLNPELRTAVAHLKAEKRIRFDADIVRATGYSKSVVSAYINGNLEASREFVQKFEEAFKLDLKSFKNVPHETPDNEDAGKTYLEQRRDQKQDSKWPEAPFMPVSAQAGYVKAVNHQQYMNQLDKYPLPPGVDPHGHIWAWWEVEGNSMYPEYCNRDMVLTSLVHPMDWDNMRQKYAYVVVTEDHVMLKKVYHRNELEWVLLSVNEEENKPQLLPVEYIKEVWVVRRHVRAVMPATKMLKELEEDEKNDRYPIV